MKKRKLWGTWLVPVCLAVVLALAACPVRAGALEGSDAVCVDRSLTALGGESRSFRMEYSLWSDESLFRTVKPCDVLLLLDGSLTGKDVREEAGAFLRELGEAAPGSRAGVVLFGETAEASGLETLDGKGLAALEAALARPSPSGEPDYAAALEKAGELAGKREDGDAPLYLLTIASGLWRDETGKSLEAIQPLRGQGAKSCTVLLCGSPEEEAESFWQSVSSAPLDRFHYVCGGEAGSCLSAVRREIASAFSVEVRQSLDPRFELPARERERLRREGAHLSQGPDGVWTVSWQADLPRGAASPWRASLTVRAKEAFPGGNSVPVDGEGAGVYRAGQRVRTLPAGFVNVPLRLELQDLETELFLGEKVRTVLDGENVEESMEKTSAHDWFGMGRTGSFSYLWETENGGAVGTLRQLGELKPTEDSVYRLRVTFWPERTGRLAAGRPVEATELSALYRVRVVSGGIRIRAEAAGGQDMPGDSIGFCIEGGNSWISFCTAQPEADPQTGRVFLAGEAEGLPYGIYTVTPSGAGASLCRERAQLCRVGVWERDDTVSTGRRWAEARFTLD